MNINDFELNFTSEERCTITQTQLASHIKLTTNFNPQKIQRIAGVDLAYWTENNTEKAVCCIVLIDYHSHKIIEKHYSIGEIKAPYISGFLSFRELPLILETAQKLSLTPDLYVFDGNGYLHIRNMGIATHASFYLNKPTIGVAKKYYKIHDVEFIEPDNIAGAYTDIVINQNVFGRALRTHKNVKPIFVSCGNYISIADTTEIILNLVNKESHIPVPTRLADLETHIMRNQFSHITTLKKPS